MQRGATFYANEAGELRPTSQTFQIAVRALADTMRGYGMHTRDYRGYFHLMRTEGPRMLARLVAQP